MGNNRTIEELKHTWRQDELGAPVVIIVPLRN